jgi:hypothetical protein
MLPTAFSRQLPKNAAVVPNEPFDFQHGLRNARIQRLASGEHSVLCFDASTDYEELLIRQSWQAAVEAAQSWVKHKL